MPATAHPAPAGRDPRASDGLAQAAVVAAALAQVAAAALLGRPGRGGEDVEALANSFDVSVAPANYALAVWGPVYAASLALAGHQAAPGRRADPLLRRVRLPVALAYAGNAAWVPAFTRRRYRLALGCLLTTLAGSTTAYARASTTPTALAPAQARLVRAPLGLLSGWVTVATPSGVAITLIDAGHRRLGAGGAGWAPPLLLALTAVTVAVTRALPASATFPGAVAWGMLGIAANTRVPVSARSTAAAAAATVVATAVHARARRRAAGAQSSPQP